MANRLTLESLLEDILGTTYVYFQPPESVKMTYPCIVYHLNSVDTKFADNNPYTHRKRYKITIIDKNPDSDIPERIRMLPMCLFEARYTKDNLNHEVYNIYY